MPESFLCPRCGKLISSYLEECSHCGLPAPYRRYKLAKTLRLPSMVKGLIWWCGLLFGLSYLLPLFLYGSLSLDQGMLGLPSPSPYSLMAMGMASSRDLIQGDYFRLVTAIFLHGGILHIVFNMLWLRDLGRMAEQLFSPAIMLLIFLLSGIGGNLLALWMPYIFDTLGLAARPIAILGASGAVFGLMGALVAYSKRIGSLQARALSKQISTWAIVIIVFGFMMPQVSNAGHVGGFVTGWLLGRFLPLRIKSPLAFDLIGLICFGVIVLSFGLTVIH